MTNAILTSGAMALGLSLALTPVVRWWGRRAGGLVCRPASGPPEIGRIVPRSGSLALIAAVTTSTLAGWRLLGTSTAPYGPILAASTLIIAGGLVDDWLRELGVRTKVLVQLAAAGWLIACGLRTQIAFLPPWVNLTLTLAWLLGVTNACNLLDILDGLVLGVAFIIAITFCWIAIAGHDAAAATLYAAIAGGALGVWRYNRHPASVFLGDAGAQWLGFLFAAMAISLHYAPPERPVALLTPLVALAVPLFDTAFVIVMRRRRGRAVLAKSADHFALRWIASGETQTQAVRRVWLLGGACSAAALVVYYATNIIGAFITTVLAWGLTCAWRRAGITPDSIISSVVQTDRPPGRATSQPEQTHAELLTP